MLEAVGEIIGKAFAQMVKALLGLIAWSTGRLTAVDKELVTATIREDMFKTEEFKGLVPKLKEKLKSSPEDIPDWLSSTLMLPKDFLIEPAFKFMTGVDPAKMPENAKQMFKGLALLMDFAVLTGIIDVAATAVSATLLRKVGDFADRMVSATGISTLFGYGLGTAMATALGPPLQYAVNEQLKPLIPAPAELIRFAIREAYVPETREWQMVAYPGVDFTEALAKHGYTDIWAERWWRAHWILPSVTIVNDMYFRAWDEDKDKLFTFYRWADLPPPYHEELAVVAHAPLTRVDIRRMFDLGTIDWDELIESARNIHYSARDRMRYAEFTAGFYISTAFEAEKMSEQECLDYLSERKVPDDIAGRIVGRFRRPPVKEALKGARDLTRSLIVKGIKKEILSYEQGVEELIAIDYNRPQAEFILSVEIGAESPETYAEFIELTNKYRKAVGLPVKEVPKALVEAEKAVKDLRDKIKKMEEEENPAGDVAAVKGELAAAEAVWRDLLKKFQSAE